MTNVDVICFGSLKIDITAISSVELRAIKKDDKFYLDHGSFTHGGSAANIAVGLSQLGKRVGLISAAGSDAIGYYLLDELRRKNVKLLFKQSKGTSAFSIIMVGKEGRIVLSYDGVCQDIKISPAILRNYKTNFLIASGIHKYNLAALPYLFKHCQAKQRAFIASSDLCQKKSQTFVELLKNIDILQLNSLEAGYLLNKKGIITMKDVEKIGNFGPKKIIVTIGKKGALYWEKGMGLIVHPPHIKVIDTFGAGDTFFVGFIFGLLEGNDIRSCLKTADMAAAYCLTKNGAREGMPLSLYELKKFSKNKVSIEEYH